MLTNKTTIATALAAIALLSTAAAAFAQPGVATGGVNVRTGPGTSYTKVGALSAGEYVDVKQCQGSWCFVDRNSGTDGWVSANYLKPANPQPAPTPAEPEIPFNFGVTVGPGGPSFSFGIGDAPPPAPVPVMAKVCFYKANNFGGAQFCVSPGDKDPTLPGGWNNSISSIRVQGGAQVTICKNPWYGGACTTVSHDKASLGGYNNAVTSYQAF